jgi:Mn2+/Fe2+ NRAMP family transporter
MSIVVVGTSVASSFSLPALADALAGRLGTWAGVLFAVGLAAAGFSSAVTAPLAAGITASGLFGEFDVGSEPRDRWFRSTWIGVLACGLLFGLAGFRPVPLILAVQAFNGVLLPVVALFLWVVVNDRALLGDRINGWTSNAVFAGTAWVTLCLGVWGLLRAMATALARPPPTRETVFLVTLVVTVVLSWPVGRTLVRARRAPSPVERA